MHPILADRSLLRAYLGVWLIPATVLASALSHGRLTPALLAYVLAFFYAFVCLSAWYVSLRAPLRTTRPLLVFGNAVGASVISSGAWMWAARAMASGMDSVGFGGGLAALVADQTPLLFSSGVLAYLLAVAVSYVMAAAGEARAAERKALELQVLAREAELKALRAQVDPHFLFNCLHSIGALIGSDPATARRMSLLLGEFLRGSMRLGAKDRVTLSEELDLARRFLDIEQVRFGSRLSFEFTLDPSVAACEVPPLLLQPLVENAVRHGIGDMIEGGVVRLDAWRRGPEILIVVENPRDPEARPRPGTGVGLENVRKRLMTQYGPSARLNATRRPDGFRVEVTIPCGVKTDAGESAASMPAGPAGGTGKGSSL